MNPLVSIIIPYYNNGKTIQETIDSISNQSYPNYEIWIINDGSTDKYSIEKLKDFETNSNIKIIHQENAGPSVARNNGIKQAQGKYIVFLDSDDLIRKETIHQCLHVLDHNPEISMVYGDNNHFGTSNFIRKQKPLNISELLVYNTIAICCMIRKSVFEQGYYFDEYLSKKGLEDYELWITMVANNFKFQYINEILFDIRITEKSRTVDVANKNSEDINNYMNKKHANFISSEYKKLFYGNKAVLESPDYKIGNMILLPYRMIKNIFKKHD